MEKTNRNANSGRRQFLGQLTTGAAAMGIASILAPIQQVNANPDQESVGDTDPDEWFKKIKGKHRIVFDVTQPHEIFPFAWPRVFLATNASTGSPEKDCGIVVVLRHTAIGYAFEDRIWSKYKFGDFFHATEIGPTFKASDAATALSVRNPFWKPQKGDFNVPGIGEVQIGINELQANGVMFCVCQAAMNVYSNIAAANMKMDAAEVLKDWRSGLITGIQEVPSGVWAVGRAQKHGCAYCFAS